MEFRNEELPRGTLCTLELPFPIHGETTVSAFVVWPPDKSGTAEFAILREGSRTIMADPADAGIGDGNNQALPEHFDLGPEDLSDGSGALAGAWFQVNDVYRLPLAAVRATKGVIADEILARLFRARTREGARGYYHHGHKRAEFSPGMPISYAGRVFDERELVNLTDSALDFWLTAGRFAADFEKRLARFVDMRAALLTNSGSSANLLAISALTSPELKERRLTPGDEVITVAAGFPSTVTPIIQNALVPVFVDVELPTYNIDCSKLEEARSSRTKAVFVAHTLGNPFDLGSVKAFCDKHKLWLIEDNCDALGAEFLVDGKWSKTGGIGDLGTFSFYPPHHMTMGEGGAVSVRSPQLKRLVLSFRDWGRDCWCDPGKDNTCGIRFGHKLGELPEGYDHKYIYSHFGYNLKVTDMQAAVGCAQLDKLPSFVEARRRNWQQLRDSLSDLEDRFILPEPTPNSNPSWFGFLLTVRDKAGFSRGEIVAELEAQKIQTRMLFAGNYLRHPAFDEMRASEKGFRVVGELTQTDRIMRDTFWVGVYPGMGAAQIGYMAEKIRAFCERTVKV